MIMPAKENRNPDALVLISPHCPHCALVLQGLQELVKEGALSRLEIVNIAADPGPAAERGVRSVPWTQIGPFILEGSHSPAELRHWVERVDEPDGMAWYFDEQLKTGGLARVENMIREDPSCLTAIARLAGDPDTAMQTRVGIAALLESIEGTGMARSLSADLARLTSHPDARVRADACHYLALTESEESIAPLEACLEDSDATVKEIAAESIEHLKQHVGHQANR
jgi:thiol-disulfide isomerase/thioredoxin